LLSSGFYSSELTTKNLWATSLHNNLGNKDHNIAKLVNLFYGSTFSYNNAFYKAGNLEPLQVFKAKNYLYNLSNMESSYLWFLKRSFSLTGLSSNFNKSTLSFAKTEVTDLNFHVDQNIILSAISSSNFFINKDFIHTTPKHNSSIITDFNENSFMDKSGSFILKDFIILNKASQVLSIENLSIVSLLLKSNSNLNSNLSFYNYLHYNNQAGGFNEAVLDFNTTPDNGKFNSRLSIINSRSENKHIVNILSLINKINIRIHEVPLAHNTRHC